MEIRPLIWLDLGRAILEGFCYSYNSLVYVVNDASLLIERAVYRLDGGLGILELIVKILIGLLQMLPKTEVVAAGLADDEAESGG